MDRRPPGGLGLRLLFSAGRQQLKQFRQRSSGCAVLVRLVVAAGSGPPFPPAALRVSLAPRAASSARHREQRVHVAPASLPGQTGPAAVPGGGLPFPRPAASDSLSPLWQRRRLLYRPREERDA
jgi:hypothetical protein